MRDGRVRAPVTMIEATADTDGKTGSDPVARLDAEQTGCGFVHEFLPRSRALARGRQLGRKGRRER
jgi:hypothetical protein